MMAQSPAVFKLPYDAGFAGKFSLDGDGEDFAAYGEFKLYSDAPTGNEADRWVPGSKDLSFETTLVIDDDYLYLFADIRDDDLRPLDDVYEAWMGDAIEFYIGMYDVSAIKNFEQKVFSRNTGDWRLSFMPTGFFALDGWLIQDVPGVQSIVFPKFSSDGYIVEAKIALDSLTADKQDFKVYNGLKMPFKIDCKDVDRRLNGDTESSLSLGVLGAVADSRYSDDWKYIKNWPIAEVVGAPEAGEQKIIQIPEQAGKISFSNPSVDLSPRAFSSLEEAIKNAKALLKSSKEGAREGQYPKDAKSILNAQILEAEKLLDKTISESFKIEAVLALYDACSVFESKVNAPAGNLVDAFANKQTRYLYKNLKNGMANAVLFGMQHSTGYGVGWENDDDRGDVKDVCGDFPAIHGEDLRDLFMGGEFLTRMQYRIKKNYERGGLIAFSWHQTDYDNRSCYADEVNYEKIVANILPGGQKHSYYLRKLDLVADFFKSLRGENGEAIPILFRPYHEHYGSWFWWGIGHCTTVEYNQLWQFTVAYLRDKKNVHNLIWVISPDLKFLDAEGDYLKRFPGKEYVDIYGVDYYFHVPLNQYAVADYKKRLQKVVQLALEHDKIPALTEIGQEGLDDPNWFSRTMINPLKYDPINRYIAFGITWRNADARHFHAPYPGHYSVPDFLDFYRDPFTLFESDLPDMYAAPRKVEPKLIDWEQPEQEAKKKLSWTQPDFTFVKVTSDADALANNKKTQYFVRDFELDHKPDAVRAILRYTGGYVLYLNGFEIFRYNLPGEKPINPDTQPFTGNLNAKAFTFDAEALSHLRSGKNRIAIEVHPGAGNKVFLEAILETDGGRLISYKDEWDSVDPTKE